MLKENFKNLKKSKDIKLIIIVILVALMIFTSWEIFEKNISELNPAAIVRENNSRVEGKPISYVLNSLLTTIFGNYQENNDAAVSNRNLISSLYNTIALYVPIRISLAATSLLFFVAYVYYYYKTKDTKFKYQIISIAVGLMLYIIVLQLSYLTKFVTFEMLGHNGIDRYYPTYLIAMLYFIFAIVINYLNKKEYSSKPYIILLIILLAITPIKSICDATITSGIYNINSQEYVNYSKNIADKIDGYIEDNAKVITLTQTEDTELYNIMLRYYLYPNHQVSVLYNVEDSEKIEKIIKDSDYKYIYVFEKNEKLDEVLNDISVKDQELKNKTLYKVEINQKNEINLLEKIYIDESI